MTIELTPETFKARRQELNLRQVDLGQDLGLNPARISEYEHGLIEPRPEMVAWFHGETVVVRPAKTKAPRRPIPPDPFLPTAAEAAAYRPGARVYQLYEDTWIGTVVRLTPDHYVQIRMKYSVIEYPIHPRFFRPEGEPIKERRPEDEETQTGGPLCEGEHQEAGYHDASGGFEGI